MTEEKYRKILDGVMEQAEKDFGEDINAPNKIELSDEEIVKALVCCKKDDCDNCPNTFGNCYANLAGYSIDFIHRLQDEKKELQKSADLFNNFNEKLNGVIAEQKAEIERLKSYRDNDYKTMQILRNQNDELNDCMDELQDKNAELQKQVDELTEKLQRPTDITEAVKPFVSQAEKDTAKEIWEDCIDEIMRGCGDDKEFWVMKILIETFKKYGVGFEVE